MYFVFLIIRNVIKSTESTAIFMVGHKLSTMGANYMKVKNCFRIVDKGTYP